MTTELTTFGGGKVAAKFQQALGAFPQESLADGIGSSYPVLHYKGKVWSFQYRGKKYAITRADDGSPVNSLDVVILNQARTKSKSYFPKWDPNSSEGERPVCASLDGVTPDADVPEKQSDTCALCPKNKWYTSPDGRKKRDCSDYKRLAVFLDPAVTARIMGSPLKEPVFLRVPPASLDGLGTFGERMQAKGYPYCSFITQIGFDAASEFPKFTFKEVRLLSDAEADVVLGMRDDPQTLRIIGDATVALAPRPMLTETRAAPPPPPAPPPAAAGWDVMPVEISTPKREIKLSDETIPADTGEVIESDADLDEMIKGVLNS